MDITATTSTATPAARATAETAAGTRINADFDMFLKMLTAQMRYQDPLNPIDSSDYAVQLATFSGVEQQTKANQTLEALLDRFNLQGLAQFAGWVGKEARSSASVAFSGTPVTLNAPAAPAADRSVLVVQDARGTLIARDEIAARATTHVWHGTDAAGQPLASGLYTLRIERFVGGQLLSSDAVETYARIQEVRTSPEGTLLVLEGGAEVLAGHVSALRDG